MRRLRDLLLVIVTLALCSGAGYWIGSRTKKTETPWYSQKFGRYVIDLPLTCPNGKEIGRMQIDYNRKTGKWKTVRDDSDASCDLPPPAKK